MTRVRLEKITKRFDQTLALDDISLDIAAGELFFLLGPSGCGKSTLLRLIAGLISPSSGQILFNHRDVTPLGTEHRNAVMCFQSYALWPHMTVAANVGFGLSVRRIVPIELNRRVGEVLNLVGLQKLANRRPNQLSGGQQQRVALARALAVQPDCLLLDEPLSNLDTARREEMRTEIRRICKTSGSTTIYVTHDQKEALSTADRIAVMNEGRIAQVGTPAELYDQPRNRFVAGFMGQANLIEGKPVGRAADGSTRFDTPLGPIVVKTDGDDEIVGPVSLSIRPNRLRPSMNDSSAPNRFTGKVVQSMFLGDATELVLQVGSQQVKMTASPPLREVPENLEIEVDPKDVRVLKD